MNATNPNRHNEAASSPSPAVPNAATFDWSLATLTAGDISDHGDLGADDGCDIWDLGGSEEPNAKAGTVASATRAQSLRRPALVGSAAEASLWQRFGELRTQPRSLSAAQQATYELLDLLSRRHASAPGPWLDQPMTLPPAMAYVMLEMVESVDATATRHWRKTRTSLFTDAEDRLGLSIASRLHAGRSLTCRELVAFFSMLKKAMASPCYDSGAPRFLRVLTKEGR